MQFDKFSSVLSLIVAVLCGILIVTQPLPVSLIIIGTVLIFVTSFITPFSVLSILLILAPLRTLIATESGINIPLDIGQMLFLVFLLSYGVHRILHREKLFSLQFSDMFIPLLLFSIFVGLTVFSAFSLHVWVSEWLKWLIIPATALIILQLSSDNSSQWIVFILVMAAIANALIGLYIFFGGSGADHLLINGRFFRAFGTFGQPNPFGGFMGLILPLSVMSVWGYGYRLISRYFSDKRIFSNDLIPLLLYSVTSIILLAGLVASWSRGAWLAFFVSVAAMAFALPRKLWQSISLSALFAAGVGIMWFSGAIPQSIMQRVTSSTSELISIRDVRGVDITSANYAITERLAHWQAALNMVTDHPWMGVGLGNYEIAYNEYRLLNWDEPLGHAHNYYLNILAEAGIMGLLAYLGLWISILWLTWKARSHPDILQKSYMVGLFGTWTYLLIHSLLDNLYVNNLFIHLGVMLGLLAIVYQQTTKSYSIEVK